MTYRRSRLEIYLEVLRAIGNGTHKPSRIIYRTNILWRTLMDALNLLLENQLIEVKKVNKFKRYYITPKGRKVLWYFEKVREALPMEFFNRESV